MQKRKKYLGVAFAKLCVIAILLSGAEGEGQMKSHNHEKGWDLDRALSDASQRHFKDSAEELDSFATELLKYPRALGQAPPVIESLVKQQLIKAERDYREGRNRGVSEQAIATFLNDWSRRLQLPEYAQTSFSQVRYLRMSLAIASPAFMAKGMSRQDMQVGEAINPQMSPFQAYHLLNSLVNQKLLNAAYQVTPAQWESERAKNPIRSAPPHASEGKPSYRYSLSSPKNPHGEELRTALAQGFSSLSFSDTVRLINDSFELLIEQ